MLSENTQNLFLGTFSRAVGGQHAHYPNIVPRLRHFLFLGTVLAVHSLVRHRAHLAAAVRHHSSSVERRAEGDDVTTVTDDVTTFTDDVTTVTDDVTTLTDDVTTIPFAPRVNTMLL